MAEYDVNYDDQRFQEVEADKKAAISEVEKTYGDMINQSDTYYNAQIDASKEWADKQTQLQQEQTDFTIEKVEQQKDQAQKDYTKEQSGAYVDWQKQKNEYGVNSEQMASSGMLNTGYSESSQVSYYNTYQNRVAAARESYNKIILNYNNAIKEARLQNNSILAEIAYKSLSQQLELSLQGFQYKNQLLLSLADKKMQTESLYYQRYQDVLKQINSENALAEQVRQFNEQMALQREQFDWQKSKYSSGGGGGGSYYRGSSSGSGGGSRIEKENGGNQIGDKTGDNNPEIDIKSVVQLGRGPLSGAELDRLVASGQVLSSQKGDKIYFENAKFVPKRYYDPFGGKGGKF